MHNFLLDWYFLLAYTLLLNDNPTNTEAMFPDFFTEASIDANNTRTGAKSTTRTSTKFNKLYKMLWKLVDKYENELLDENVR